MNFKTVSRSKPCSICMKADWCAYDEQSETSICRRVPGGISKTDKSGGEYWIYPPEGSRQQFTKSFVPTFAKEINVDERHLIYSELLDQLGLSGRHLHDLTLTRKIPEEQVAYRQYKTLRGSDSYRLASKLVSDHGESICSRIPGFILNENGQHRLAISHGLVIPVRQKNGKIIGLRVRTDDPRQYLWMSSPKAESGSHLHFPLDNYSKVEVLRVTEGELKADIASIYTGIPTISLPGVSSWRKIIPFLHTFRPKLIKVAFDSDLSSNRVVASSLISICDYFQKTGFNFEVESWKN